MAVPAFSVTKPALEALRSSDQRVLLAPELAPGNVVSGTTGVGTVPCITLAPGVTRLGAAGDAGNVGAAGDDTVLDVPPGVPVVGAPLRAAGASFTVSGLTVVVPAGGGGPASGRPDAGGILVLVGSVNAPLPVALLPGGGALLSGRFGGTKLGVPSLAFGALLPNGLR